MQCFLCAVKLDGWESDDDPIREHLAHSGHCNWALSLQAGFAAQQEQDATDDDAIQQQQDPMCEQLVEARTGTFSSWPHEGKRGWKCKISKMVEAGWCFDPAPNVAEEEEEGDGVTCFYCSLSLDGWEPKDDPMEEHRRRSPDCAFFALVERFGSTKAVGKAKGKKGAAARASTASKTSRMSTQSAVSQEPGFADAAMPDEEPAVDDSIITTASNATATGTTKGKKKAGRPKAAAKGAKGKKKTDHVDSEIDVESMYPDLSIHIQSQAMQEEEVLGGSQAQQAEEPAPEKRGRKGTRQSKQQQVDSSVLDMASVHIPQQTKQRAIRGRKPKAQPEQTPEAEPEIDSSEVSAQLQEELERSMSFDIPAEAEAEATPQAAPAKAKRGVKRTSDGLKKQDDSGVSGVVAEFPVPPEPTAKGKRGRKPSNQVTAVDSEAEAPSQAPISIQENVQMLEAEAEAEAKPTKTKKAATTKGKGKARKASSTRSSRSSKATVTAEPEQPQDYVEDLERDEREIEAELERIAAEQAVQAEQERVAEFEPSPSQKQVQVLDEEMQADESKKLVEEVAGSPPQLPPLLERVTSEKQKENATPSPSGSDKENQPCSIMAASSKEQSNAPVPTFSPTKTTRIPLAPGTPNRRLLSPSKQLSPSKHISHLRSTTPWHPVDLDTVLLPSPQPTPGTLANRLAGAAGALTSPEKGLTVEAWVKRQAEKAEEELRRKCEETVGAFEREGVRALGVLDGVVVG